MPSLQARASPSSRTCATPAFAAPVVLVTATHTPLPQAPSTWIDVRSARRPQRRAPICSSAHMQTAHTQSGGHAGPGSVTSSTKICTSLTAVTVAGQISQMAASHDAGADMAEIRVDLLEASEQEKWPEVLAARSMPVIVTNRAAWEGGKAASSERNRLLVIIEAAKLGAEFVDVELAAVREFRSFCAENGVRLEKTKLILSHHNFERSLTKKEVSEVQAGMLESGADICKIAMMATSALDNALVFDTLRAAVKPMIMIAMGELGQVSRIVGGKYGSFLSFASVAVGREAAPGQVDVATLRHLYRFKEINADTPLYGVIGNPVAQSMSPAVHNTAMTEMGLSGAYVALKVDDDVPGFVRSMTQRGFDGFSVTIPAKVDVMDGVDVVEEVARKIGAVNTVVRGRDGVLMGHNTDWMAAISAVEEQVSGGLQDKKVLVIGAGGAGRALAFGALERGAAEVTVANRTARKAETLAAELGQRARGVGLDSLSGDADGGGFDVVMNSSSVGMQPRVDESPVGRGVLGKGVVVFDAVYNPMETRLLREAREKGCVCVSGVEMFVRQAAEQFKLWFPGKDAPVETMRAVVMKKLGK